MPWYAMYIHTSPFVKKGEKRKRKRKKKGDKRKERGKIGI